MSNLLSELESFRRDFSAPPAPPENLKPARTPPAPVRAAPAPPRAVPPRPQRAPWSKSGLKGVTEMPSGRFRAELRHGGVKYLLGTHDTAELAGRAVDAKSVELRGDDAMLNFRRD